MILRRQEKAAKLRQCQCKEDEHIDGFLCEDIKTNMEELCFPVEPVANDTLNTTVFPPDYEGEDFENEITDDDSPRKKNSAGFTRNSNLVYLQLLSVIMTFVTSVLH